MDFLFSNAAKIVNDHVVPFVEHAVVPFVNNAGPEAAKIVNEHVVPFVNGAAPVVAHHASELSKNAGHAFHAAGQLTQADVRAGVGEFVKAAGPMFAVAAASLAGTADAARVFFANIDLNKLVQDLHRDIEQGTASIDGRVLTIGVAVAGGVLAVAVLIPIVVYFGLPALGFTEAGIAPGSAAAAWQSILGDVVAGSLFALLQGAMAGGIAGASL